VYIDLAMPALSPTMESGTLVRWFVKEGAWISPGDILAQIETDKATMELEAVDEGWLDHILVADGSDDVGVGTIIARLRAGQGGAGHEATAPAVAPAPAPPLVKKPAPWAVQLPPCERPAGPGRSAPADLATITPLAARIAAARGIDLSGVHGSGPDGRIVRSDLGIVARSVDTVSLQRTAGADHAMPAPAAALLPNSPNDSARLSTMPHMIAATQSVPHFYLMTDCRIDALLALRAELNAALAIRGVKVSLNDLLIKALALALTQVPDANVFFDDHVLCRLPRVDLAFAVPIPGGLVTPVVRDVGALSLSAIASATKTLAGCAREGTLQPQDYDGGTASISNLGMYGIGQILPPIIPPHAMTLGVGAARERAIASGGKVSAGQMLCLTAAFDHRAIGGATGAALVAALERLIEQPLEIIS
jgi:pyruvate dehydrogenase E2 component (dihydrolipoamide acetyltransferase)